MLGLKRGTVMLLPHQKSWEDNAKQTISLLKALIPDVIIDAQHIGSTAIMGIHAKPIIDIVVGVRSLDDIKSKIEHLQEKGIFIKISRGSRDNSGAGKRFSTVEY